MKYQGKITDPKDLVTKEYVDTGLSGKLGTSGDGSNVTAAFTAASSRTNISTGEKLTVIFGKIAKWFADLGAAAFRGVDATPTAGSTNLVESDGVKSAIEQVKTDLDTYYDTGFLPNASDWTATNITTAMLQQYRYITVSQQISASMKRLMAPATIPIYLLLDGETTCESVFGDGTTFYANATVFSGYLRYYTGSSGWGARIVLTGKI